MKSAWQQLKEMPQNIWVLGFVSMLTDMSTEIIHALLPTYLRNTFGVSMGTIGTLEGLTDATAYFFKLISGVLSDYLKKRKTFLLIGYGLAAFAKALLPLAQAVHTIIGARILDRIGKGLRDAPRDALIAESAPADLHGAAYGLRQALDQIGAIIGPITAIVCMLVLNNNIPLTFFIAAIPGFLAAYLVMCCVHEPKKTIAVSFTKNHIAFKDIKEFNFNFWWLIGIAIIATFARFGDSFLLIRAQHGGLPLMFIPLVLVLLNAAYAVVAFPMGHYSDYMNRSLVLVAGLGILTVSHIILALATSIPAIAIGIILWGVHMGMTQGLLAAMVAGLAPKNLRGTAFGIFNFSLGIALLLSNLTAGILWDQFGQSTTFLLGSACALIAALGILLRYKKYAHIS